MYLHLGQSVVVPYRDIIGIFDLDNSTYSKRTQDTLQKAEKEGRVVSAWQNLPRSMVVCERKGKSTLYLAQPAPATLARRAEGMGLE